METNGVNNSRDVALRDSRGMIADWSHPDAQKLLINTVAQGASPQEFAMFRELCIATGLNPFQRQIWFIKAGGRAQIMTGIWGYHQIANKHPQYDGSEVETVEDEKGNPVKAVARVYRKDRSRPAVGIARWSEFNKGHGNWKTMPFYMLEKCAEAIALRKAFPQELSGTYTEEEMGREYALEMVGAEVLPAQKFDAKRINETYLLMQLKEGSAKGKTLGDAAHNHKHLENHLNKYREKYSHAEQEAIALRIEELAASYERSSKGSVARQVAAQKKREKDELAEGGTYQTVDEAHEEALQDAAEAYAIDTTEMDDDELEAHYARLAEQEDN